MDTFVFATDYHDILSQLEQINPVTYAKTRNYVDGAVTRLSPYLSRGVISTAQVVSYLISEKYTYVQCEQLVKELAWRDYYQKVWQHTNIEKDIHAPQQKVADVLLPQAILQAQTGIEAIDHGLQMLYTEGYMHNHCRMYVAALVCNMAQTHWLQPAQWMYYHLLDGDWASNACSWQWVAGSFSSKKYIANQENINKYTQSTQTDTYLDHSYAELEAMVQVPDLLQERTALNLKTQLPKQSPVQLDVEKPTLIYTYYNLDPAWRQALDANRVLLLEPSHFNKYTISAQCLNFALALAQNIAHIQIFVGEYAELAAQLPGTKYFKEHPTHSHFVGTADARQWICPEVEGFYASFHKYWKQVEKAIKPLFVS